MTKDDFRIHQKALCRRPGRGKRGVYGCYCCRVISDLNAFKKFARKVAKTKFRRATTQLIKEQLQ